MKTVHIKKNTIYSKKRFWAGILLAQFILFFIFSKVGIVINLFAEFFEFQKEFHQKLCAAITFSVGDIFYIALIILILFFIINIFKKNKRNHFFNLLLIVLNLLYSTYQIFWGLLYFQEPIIKKLPTAEITLDQTKSLALKYLELCKETRSKAEENRIGIFKISNINEIQYEILSGQNNLPSFLDPKKSTNINAFKPSIFGRLMNYTGILGYYNPFTAEAQYNDELPPTGIPFTLAHESMHQLGYAREQEASFTAYLIGINSNNIDLKYSTQYYVLRSLLNSLADQNEDFVKEVIENYSPEMKRDRAFEKMFVEKHKGFGEAFFRFTNDFFLKSNQQEGSITYSYFNDLLLRYEISQNLK